MARAVSVLEICPGSQQFGQKVSGHLWSCSRDWRPEHLQRAVLGGARAERTARTDMALPDQGDSGGNRSAICFSTCYTGFAFGWKLWVAVFCQPWALMYSWKNHNIVPPGLVLGRLLETPVANDLFRQLCHPDLVFRSMHRWPGANALYTSTTMCTSLVLLRHRIHNIDVRSYLVLSTLNLCRPVETCLIYTSKLIEEVITHNSQSFHHLTQWGMKTLFCLDCNCLYIPENTIPYSQFFVKTPQVCR